MFNKFSKPSGIYKINDNIDKFEFTINFRHINSVLKLPQFNLEKILKGNTNFDGAATTADNISITTIKWQEKILSPNERELYKDITNCTSDEQRKYHQWLKKEESLDGKKKNKARKRNKKVQEENTPTTTSDFNIFTYTNNDNFIPLDDKADSTNIAQTALKSSEPSSTMYVYIALHRETQLVALKWYAKERLLHIYPDFNDIEDNPYVIEIDTDYRDFFAYALRNNSKKRPVASNAKAVDMCIELPSTPYWQTEQELAKLFAMPPKRTQRVSLFFEIRQAAQFDYGNIHVRYHIRLPAGTQHEEGLLQAATHTATTNGSVYFGYNWQLTLLCLEDFNAVDLLHIYFEVLSIDSWERERIEGYTHYSTYLVPGTDHIHLQCIRPAESFMDALNRYFVGGRRNFDYMRYFTLDSEKQKFISRYHCRMEKSGQLELTVGKITQSNCDLLPTYKNRTNAMTLDDIMMAFREARKKLQDLTL